MDSEETGEMGVGETGRRWGMGGRGDGDWGWEDGVGRMGMGGIGGWG